MRLSIPDPKKLKTMVPKRGTLAGTAAKLTPTRLKKRVIAGTVAAATAISLLTSAAFTDPSELLKDDGASTAPTAIVETYVPNIDDGGDGDEDEGLTEEEERKRGGLRARMREMLLRLPLAVRALVCVPLWCVGWGVTALSSVLGAALGTPVGSAIVQVLLSAAIVFGLILATIKTVAPDIPLKKLVNKKTVSVAVLAAIAGELVCIVLELTLPDGEKTVDLLKSLLTTLVLLGFALPLSVRIIKKEHAAQEKAA